MYRTCTGYTAVYVVQYSENCWWLSRDFRFEGCAKAVLRISETPCRPGPAPDADSLFCRCICDSRLRSVTVWRVPSCPQPGPQSRLCRLCGPVGSPFFCDAAPGGRGSRSLSYLIVIRLTGLLTSLRVCQRSIIILNIANLRA
jgi:hypothetical protein